MSIAILKEVGNNTQEVDGVILKPLTLKDLSSLLTFNSEMTEELFDGKANIKDIAVTWPNYAMLLLSLASDLTYDECETLSLGTQISCLLTILDMSKIDGDLVGKLIKTVSELMASAAESVK